MNLTPLTKVPYPSSTKEVCMQGKIFSRQKCFICKGPLVHDERRHGCFCPKHPQVAATRFVVRFPGNIYQNHITYEAAVQALNYLRYEKGTRGQLFNSSDYKTAKPNSFGVLKDQYLARKKTRLSYKKIGRYIEKACEHFGLARNVREVTSAEIEDYLFSISGISDKTRFNHCSQLHDFWMWCLRRKVVSLAEMPVFPTIDYELGWRSVTTWENQELVLEKIKERTYTTNPKIWLAVDMLATYTELRPDDIRRITEGNFHESGYITIHNPTKKKNKFKMIKLHPDHIEEWKLIRDKFPGLPEAPFFRHVTTVANRRAGTKWGIHYLKKQWDAARDAVGLDKSISLYNGTKHTTATETAQLLGSEKAERASGLTNKAFRRYNQAINDGAFEVVTEIMKAKKRAKMIPISKTRRGTE